MGEIETEMQDDAVCPHCGEIYQDTWELFTDGDGEETEIQCEECEKKYLVVQNVRISYSSYVREVSEVHRQQRMNEPPTA